MQMGRGKASGIRLSKKDASIVLGMEARGDRNHDIAAWFGVNQGRIAEVKDGSYGTITAAPVVELPPKGPPGLKGRRLRAAVMTTLEHMSDDAFGIAEVRAALLDAIGNYDANEQ